MASTLVGLFDERSGARLAIQALIDAGFPRVDMNVVFNNSDAAVTRNASADAHEAAIKAVGAGALIGGFAGLMLGLSISVIPSLGSIPPLGPLISGITGALVGAIAGAVFWVLGSEGVPKEEAMGGESLQPRVTLLTVKISDDRVERATSIMNRYGAVEIDRRANEKTASSEINELAAHR